MAESSSSTDNTTHHQNLISSLEKKFILENGNTFIKRGKSFILFLDATMRIIGKVEDGQNKRPAVYQLSVSSRDCTREILLSTTAFNDLKSLSRGLNKEFGGGDFVFGGAVQAKDVKDYHLWLKDIYLNSGQLANYFASPYIGLVKPESHWVLNEKQQIGNHGFLDQHNKIYFVLHEDLKDYCLSINPSLIQCFRTFNDIFKRIVNASSAFASNETSFLLVMSFMLKSYLNNYFTERTDTGESRYCMIFSPEMSTGKSTTMQVLAAGQGVDIDNTKLILSCGNAQKVGTTMKPMREVFEKTNLFVFLNDYVPNSTLDEFLLQSHEGYAQGSGETGIKVANCSVLLTGNKAETERLAGRVVKIPYRKSQKFSRKDLEEFEALAKANKGYLIAWCHHYASVYFDDAVRDFEKYLEYVLRKYCVGSQARYLKAWSSTITTYCLVQYSVTNPVLIHDLLNTLFNMIKLEGISVFCDWGSLANDIINKIKSNPSKASTWLKVNTSFSDANKKAVKSIAIDNNQLKAFPNVNFKTLLTELKNYGENSCNCSIDFVSDEDSTQKAKLKAYKIPIRNFTEQDIKFFYEALNEDTNEIPVSSNVSPDELDELRSKSIDMKTAVTNVLNEKLGLPFRSADRLFSEDLTPISRRDFEQLPLQLRPIYRKAFEAGKKRRLNMDNEEE